ncbi:hypothetical protein RHGRI_015467 [Rhododendron griersonianum]|uniref:Uncharacterized protein n=1 Tax=Rhododendron griersonianum TaxID=479676 RepID=A0AAV6KDW4_9ERIC|nr:hypothetical protein RHGRI_015467 [Rhododendron griersonianum]
MSQGENDYADVLQRLTSTISENIGEGAQKTKIFSSARIYRVPKDLHKLKESAYTPRLIAIGPLHRNEEHLQTPMQHVKMRYADNLLCRLTVGMKGMELAEKKNAVLQECVAEMKESLDDAKKCYAEGVTLNEEMLLVDGCFILEFLCRTRSLELIKNRAEKKGKKPIDGGDNGNSKVRKHQLFLSFGKP